MNEQFVRQVELPCSIDRAFAWHARPGALERLTPPWERVELISAQGGIEDGGRVELQSFVGPLPLTWVAEHFDYRKNEQFCDRQISGPFAHWEHRHRFEITGSDSCRLIDDITYRLPGRPFSHLAKGSVQRRLERMFSYRHAITRADLGVSPPMRGKVVVSGASGLIGQALIPFLQTQGWDVDRLVRRKTRAADEISWSPQSGTVDWPESYRCDAIIHLAGANVAGGRWTASRKKLILESRTQGTATLARSLQSLREPPSVFLCGSATGFYGDTGNQEVTEEEGRGKGFLADVCEQWEDALADIDREQTRIVVARTGVVLSPRGGALAKMLPAFKLGLGGKLGTGAQWLSWIGIDDWLHVAHRILTDDRIEGPINVTAPNPVRQAEFAQTLAGVLSRPSFLPAPAPLLRLALGQMSDETLLASSRVSPAVLEEISYKFLHPSLEKALRHVLGRQSPV
ncbi:MAG: TIGR01777 family oxidoreductase [Synoicihabitans sp.]